jgi:hypothetical protein
VETLPACLQTVPFPGKTFKVHQGYNTAFLSLWAQVVAFINKARSVNPALPLYFPHHRSTSPH